MITHPTLKCDASRIAKGTTVTSHSCESGESGQVYSLIPSASPLLRMVKLEELLLPKENAFFPVRIEVNCGKSTREVVHWHSLSKETRLQLLNAPPPKEADLNEGKSMHKASIDRRYSSVPAMNSRSRSCYHSSLPFQSLLEKGRFLFRTRNNQRRSRYRQSILLCLDSS